jgi:hypothetical protein
MSTAGSTPLPSIESMIVDALPDDDRQVLRQGAVLRYITRDLAGVVTGSAEAARRLVEHPLVQGGGQGRADELWTIPEPLREALISGWADTDEVRARVARVSGEAGGIEALYARLAAAGTRASALDDLTTEFTSAIRDNDVPRAHDLLRLLDEWPVAEAEEARTLHDRLAPRLRRHSRALPDREATASYLERGFEQPVWTLLLDDPHRWMLHLHAPGGGGKTMFVKNVLGRRCPDRDIPVARIDFDYVARLGIATTEPWRLLLSVAAQLDPQLPNWPFQYMLDSYGVLQDVVRPEALPRIRPTAGADPNRVVDELAVDAARQVPLKFRTELATAVGTGPVVVALDTVENVLHTAGADLGPVLAAFDDIVHGDPSDPLDEGVPGLRLIVSGRFDLAGDRPVPEDRTRPRMPEFRERWLGTDPHQLVLGGTSVQLGRAVISLEVPGFSTDEAQRFLTAQQPPIRTDVVAAIVARTHENPMKLALLAEYVQRNPDVSADTITAIDEIDLFYLVDRVVDHITDSRVQWLLRWGALLPVITRDALEQVIWPALKDFVDSRAGYDDARTDGLPESPHDVSRWEIPTPEAITGAGAREEAWRDLLGYAARASWVSVVPDLPDTVMLHPDVREPLRQLLRRGGLPVYDDIHRRSFEYWSRAVESTERALQTTAPRALLFHAYQPWAGADHDGDRLFRDLLRRRAEDRTVREGLAQEVLELADQHADRDVDGPSSAAQELAHLELAEAAINTANQRGAPIAEGALSAHLHHITSKLRARQPRRIAFLEAVFDEAAGRIDAGWAALDRALAHPPADFDPAGTHLALVAGWVASRTPPASALDVVRRLLAESTDTRVTKAAAAAQARGLLAAERWPEAVEAASRADSAELLGAALVGLGDANSLLEGMEYPRVWLARARLLRYEPTRALLELGDDTQPATAGAGPRPAELLVRGQAFALLDRYDETSDALSQAASNADPVASVEATLELARFMGRAGRLESATSHLMRLTGFTDPVVALRAQLLTARLHRVTAPTVSQDRLAAAEQLAATASHVPPSTVVELAVTRLAVHGVTDQRVRELEVALTAVPGPGPRLLALRDLADVPAAAASVAPDLVAGLRSLTEVADASPAAVVLARVELERVLGDAGAAAGLLDRVAGGETDPAGALSRAAEQARARLGPQSFSPAPASVAGDSGDGGYAGRPAEEIQSMPNADEPRPLSLQIGTELPGGDILIRSGAPQLVGSELHPLAIVPADVVARGPYSLAKAPEQFLQQLRETLEIADLDRALLPTGSRPLYLYLATEDAARWPWEAAMIDDSGTSTVEQPMAGVQLMLRRQRHPHPPSNEAPVGSPTVLVTVLDEHRDRGQVLSLLDSFYGGRAELIVQRSVGGTSSNPSAQAARILHVVASPVQRNRIPALQVGSGDHLTAESLALSIGAGPRLLILDLALVGSDFDAAEQVMIANAFCWHLVRIAPELDVLCGAFGGANDRVGSLRQLVEHVAAGDSLATTIADLQRNPGLLPGGRHPVRDVVSLTTDHPDRRFLLR